MPEQAFMKFGMYIMAPDPHLSDAIFQLFPSMIPTLQSVILLRRNLDIGGTPVPIFMKLSLYVVSHKAILAANLHQ
jgi:hypothetical protein